MKDPDKLSIFSKLFPNAYFRAKINDIRLSELNNLMRSLNIVADRTALDEGLSYFRECYQTRAFPYPGDFIYYEMIQDCMKKGLSLENSLVITKTIINREIYKLDSAKRWGFHYQENWNIKI